MKERRFRDRARIFIASGKGGDGSASFRREKFIPKGGPDGGDGGRGGHVYIQADAQLDSLLHLTYHPHQRAGNGQPGRKRHCTGKNGADLHIKVPCGTLAYEEATGNLCAELLEDGQSIRLARGGRGGLGNRHFVTSTHQAPREYTPGEEGQEKTLRLELKTIADVGLIGFPNAGKSTLLRALSRARPKTAPYPFTTLTPVIGTLAYPDHTSLRIADIPGLIEGAHQGVGLGHDFLRHIERTRLLVFVIDIAGQDGRRPEEDYLHLREELRLYDPALDHRPYLLVANKMDLPEASGHYKEFVENTGETPLAISAHCRQGLEPLKDQLLQALRDHLQAAPQAPRPPPGNDQTHP